LHAITIIPITITIIDFFVIRPTSQYHAITDFSPCPA
jgi:hypothetical protein